MVKVFKYIGYFSAVAGAVTTIYLLAAFFTNLQNDIKTVITTTDKIQIEQYTQGEKQGEQLLRTNAIILEMEKQRKSIYALDKSLIDHYKQDKKNTDELIRYFEMKDEAKKK